MSRSCKHVVSGQVTSFYARKVSCSQQNFSPVTEAEAGEKDTPCSSRDANSLSEYVVITKQSSPYMQQADGVSFFPPSQPHEGQLVQNACCLPVTVYLQ